MIKLTGHHELAIYRRSFYPPNPDGSPGDYIGLVTEGEEKYPVNLLIGGVGGKATVRVESIHPAVDGVREPTRVHRHTFDKPEWHTGIWTDNSGGQWQKLSLLGKYYPPRYRNHDGDLEEFAVSSCDDWKRIFVDLRYVHQRFGYRGEPKEFGSVNITHIVLDESSQRLLQELWQKERDGR